MRCAAESYRNGAGRSTVYGVRFTHHASRITHHASCIAYCVLRIAYCVLLLTACHFPGVVRPTVKIGLVAPFEGRYRYIGYDVIYAVRMAIREANASGGVGGYNVELVAYDDGADPAMAIQQALKLAVDPTVVAAVGHFRERTTSAALPAYDNVDIPLVAPAVLISASAWEEFDRAYRLGPSADAMVEALFAHLEAGEQGRDRVALVTDGGPLGEALRQNAHAYRFQVSPVMSPEDADWPAQVLASGVGTVLIDANPVIAGEVVSALRQAGWAGAFVGGPELAAPDFAAVAGEAATGTVFVTSCPFAGDETGVSGDGKDLRKAYQSASNGVPPGALALSAYEATWVLLEALERDVAAHGKPTRGGVAAALAATEREGGLGRITFDATHAWGGAPLYWYRVETGGIPYFIGSEL
jgi:branched-chain amino acid transport system substrate-binding protein